MSEQQIVTGARSVLSHPCIYDLFQAVMGASKGRAFFAEHHIRAGKGDTILDLGCGTAEILNHLPAGITYWGYDISAAYIDAARKRHFARQYQRVAEPVFSRVTGNVRHQKWIPYTHWIMECTK